MAVLSEAVDEDCFKYFGVRVLVLLSLKYETVSNDLVPSRMSMINRLIPGTHHSVYNGHHRGQSFCGITTPHHYSTLSGG